MAEKRTLTEDEVLSKLISNREYWQEVERVRQAYRLPPGGFVDSLDGVERFALWDAQTRERYGRDPVDALSWDISQINRLWQYPGIVDEIVLNELLHGGRGSAVVTSVVQSGPLGPLDSPEELSASLPNSDESMSSGLREATGYAIFGRAVFIDSGQLQQVEWQLTMMVPPGAAKIPSDIRLHSFSVQPCNDWATGDSYELESEGHRHFLSGKSVSLDRGSAMVVHWKAELPCVLEDGSLYGTPHLELDTPSPFGIAMAERPDGAPADRVRLVTDVGAQSVKGALPAFPVPQVSREPDSELLGLDTIEGKWRTRYERLVEKANRRPTAKEFAESVKLAELSQEDCIRFWHFAKKHINPKLTIKQMAPWTGYAYDTLRSASSRLGPKRGHKTGTV